MSARLVFVGGAPRSGTTLVQRLLGAHSQIYAGPEFDFVPRIAALRRSMQASVASGRIAAIADEEAVDRGVRAFLHTIFDARAAQAGAAVFAEKTPSNLLEFPALLEIFPEARFVFVLRDPRAIAASMKEVARKHRARGRRPPVFCRDVLASAAEIERYWQAGFAARAAAPDRVIAVHYEDVLSDPEAEARRLCAFLGLAEEPGMTRIEEAGFEKPGSDVSAWYSGAQLEQGIDRSALSRQEEALTAAERGALAQGLGAHPQIARYGLAGMRAGARTRALMGLVGLRRRAGRLRRGAARRIGGWRPLA